MYLKSLVLKGFKSFADRSVLTLEPGITAIVGPNGSGKSNISDAVLWVLGERNAKHLRGQAMEDVIFAGSSARKATGVAEVDLVLDNSDGTLPIDYDEVVITRRMYRSGESEYLINGTVARRIDVLDILHDSGLGTGTHSIISQGSLDSILQSRPEDRRALIEEAAGVLKHKQRKAKSERKLESMDQHLARARDVVNEVGRQLGPLERKAKKARTYQELSAQLAEVRLQLAVDDLRKLQVRWDEVQKKESTLTGAVEAQRATIEAAESAIEELQEQIRSRNVDAGELTRRHRAAASAVEHLDSTVMMMRERRRAATARAGEIELEMEGARAKEASAQADLAQAELTLSEVQAEHARARAEVERLEAARAEVEQKRAESESRLADLAREAHELEARLETAHAKNSETKETLANGLAHIQVIEARSTELAGQVEALRTESESAAKEAEAAEAVLAALVEEEAAARRALDESVAARDEARRELDEARGRVHGLQAQIDALEEVEHANAIAAGPARAWLSDHADELSGALEPLVHAVRAHEGYVGLVEMLLGADVAALLVDDATSAEAVAHALRDQDQQGAVSLLLRRDGDADRSEAIASAAAGAAGVRLIDEVEFPESDARAVRALLGDVVVCDSLEKALEAHGHDTAGLRFVSRDGAIVWPEGKVTIGSAVADEEQGALARARHLDELRDELIQAQRSVTHATEVAEKQEEALRKAQAISLELSQRSASQRGLAQAARAQVASAAEKLASAEAEHERVRQQHSEAEAVIADARPTVARYEQEIEECSRGLETAKEQQVIVQEQAAPLREQVQAVVNELSQAKVSMASLAERDTYTSRLRDARRHELDSLHQQLKTAAEQLRKKRAGAERLEPLFALFDELSSAARRSVHRLEEGMADAQDSSSGLHAQETEARSRVREARARLDAANEELSATRVEKGRLELQVEGAISTITEECGTPLDRALESPELQDRAEAEDASFKLTRRITNLGTINPDAAAEYDELKERYDYLSGQLSDLDTARRSLSKIDRIIDERMKEDFARTYEEVDRNFQEIFATLFPGGSARLSLVDPEDMENTGVEVNAQPAGKRITKMMLMSGGEKSLTALALLFAVYRTRSTPFYILDEVEAALDDTNLRRLIAYIDELRDTTQLLMITHQRRTMEMADVLFGVSMQGDGVTKVISQKLEKALRYAE